MKRTLSETLNLHLVNSFVRQAVEQYLIATDKCFSTDRSEIKMINERGCTAICISSSEAGVKVHLRMNPECPDLTINQIKTVICTAALQNSQHAILIQTRNCPLSVVSEKTFETFDVAAFGEWLESFLEITDQALALAVNGNGDEYSYDITEREAA